MNLGISYKQLNKNNTTPILHGVDLIKDELVLLLNTKKYDLYFNGNLGLDLEKYLYLSNTEATFHLIKEDIKDLLLKYGKAQLKELTIHFKGQGTLYITLLVLINNTSDILEIPFSIEV